MTALALATIALGLSPGPAVLATVGRSLALGLYPTFLFISGIVLGDLLFSLLAMLGLATVAVANASLFLLLKLAGGCYLILLGIQGWRDSRTPDFAVSPQESGWKLITGGFLLTASNPKDLLFFVGFLPLFVDLRSPGMGKVALASCVIVACFFATLSFFAILANSARRWLESSSIIRPVHRIVGILMITAGLMVIIT